MSTAYQREAIHSERDLSAAELVLSVRTRKGSDSFPVLNRYGLPQMWRFDGDLWGGCASTSVKLLPITALGRYERVCLQ